MRGLRAVLPATNKFKAIYPVANSWVAALTPKKQENITSHEKEPKRVENPDPIVVFSKPPPIPPVVGPLVLFSLMEDWLTRDDE